MEIDELVPLNELCRVTGRSYAAIWAEVARGRIPAVRHFGRVLVTRVTLNQLKQQAVLERRLEAVRRATQAQGQAATSSDASTSRRGMR